MNVNWIERLHFILFVGCYSVAVRLRERTRRTPGNFRNGGIVGRHLTQAGWVDFLPTRHRRNKYNLAGSRSDFNEIPSLTSYIHEVFSQLITPMFPNPHTTTKEFVFEPT